MNSNKYTHEQAQTFKKLLAGLPKISKPKPDSMRKRELVASLAHQIDAALKRGHNYKSIAARLSSNGLEISPATLKSYVNRSRAGAQLSKGKAPAAPESEAMRGQESAQNMVDTTKCADAA